MQKSSGMAHAYKRILFPASLLLLTSLACSSTVPVSPPPSLSSGIDGMVTEGPMCPGPVRVGDNSCPDQPYQATIMVLDDNHDQVTQVLCDSNGHFVVQLTPGMYILHPLSVKPLPHAPDQSVVVDDGQYTQVNIVYDTGMR
jgi:hypothetical protein